MKGRIADLPCWKGKVEMEAVNGGHTNHNFMVVDDGEKFFVRVGEDLEAHCIMRFNELAVSRAAHCAGIAPEIVWHGPGVMVTRYIEGKTLTNTDISDSAMIDRIVPLIRRCHRDIEHNLRGPVLMYWVFHVSRNYAATLREQSHGITSRLPGLMKINTALEEAVGDVDIGVTHNDLLAANFIDDGDKLWIVDWEYAGFNTPLYDLACLSSFCELPEDSTRQALEAYYETEVTEALCRRFIALKCASELAMYLWGLVAKILQGHDIDYDEIVARHCRNFEKAWQEFQKF